MTLSINGKTYEAGELIAYVKKLEKENAELKKKNLNAQDAVTMQMYTNKANKEIANKQLTKAKEIVRALLKHTYGQNLNTQNDFDLYLGRIKEAEQFISEVRYDR